MSVAAITIVVVPVEEDLDDIVIKSVKVLIHLECDGKVSLAR